MSSSSFYDVRLEAAAEDAARRVVYHKVLDGLALPWRDQTCHEVRYNEALTVEVTRSHAETVLRGLLCNEVIFEMAAGRHRLRLPENQWFLHELGESVFTIEELAPGQSTYRPIFEINLRIVPSPETLHQYKVMADDLVQVHAGLARDVVSRSVVRRDTFEGAAVRDLQPEPMVAQLREAYEVLRAALGTINRRQGRALQVVVTAEPFRAGERLSAGTLQRALYSPGTVLTPQGMPLRLGAVPRRRLVLAGDADLEEHRQIAARLKALARLAESVAMHCEQTAALLRHERSRWGDSPRGDHVSVFQTTYAPRLELLERLRDEARALAAGFRALRDRYPFLRRAGPPHGRPGPTPLFTGRAGYREAYSVIGRAAALSGLLVDSDSIRLHYRSLASMFEYWCFVKTVHWLRERYGAPEPRDRFRVVGGIYRPALEPGQFFLFRLDDQHTLRVTYEPSILPWRQAYAEGHRYGATLTANPLRPDILVEILRGPRVVAAMVLDAKATTRFSLQKIREMSDYARQIFEIPSGRQPVRRVFILHRDPEWEYLSNLPPRGTGPRPPTTDVFGAAACVPEKVDCIPPQIGRLLRSFIRACLAWPSEALPAADAEAGPAGAAAPDAAAPEPETLPSDADWDSLASPPANGDGAIPF